MVAHAARVRGLLRVSTPVLAGIAIALAGVVGTHVWLAEARARAGLPEARGEAPNVLLIVMDDVRIDDLSLYGYHRETTPNLTRLAQRAIRFDQARSTAPWTLPSHGSMLTGRWPHELSVTVDQPLDAAQPTLAGFLAARGYATAGFVANTYYCNSWYGLDRGFAHYEDFYDNRALSAYETFRSSTLGRWLVKEARLEPRNPGVKGTRKTAAMINRDLFGWLDRQGDRPFFAFLNYYDAHGPFQPPAGFDRRFGLSALPVAERESVMRSFARVGSGKVPPAEVPAIVARATEIRRDSYDSCIAYLDEQIGKLVAELERRGLLDTTLVILTSDHGEQFNEHHLSGHGNSLYQELIHVPLVIMPPARKAAGRVVEAPVSLRNLAATVADVTGLGDVSPFPGQSLRRCWATDSGPVAADDPVLAEVEYQEERFHNPSVPVSVGALQALVTDRRAYIHNTSGREELYDLERDRAELKDLAGGAEAAPLLERFRRELARHVSDDPTIRRR
jgi:arylsulfatase A-like enzyme